MMKETGVKKSEEQNAASESEEFPPPTESLSPRQEETLNCIIEWRNENGYSPTIREIGRVMSISSTNGVNDHLKALRRKGYIRREEGRSRAIVPIYNSEGRLCSGWSSENAAGSEEEESYEIPVLGSIAAGTPLLAVENREDTIRLGASLLPKPEGVFALKVSGDSMINDGILDGDTILVRKANQARDNTIVAVMVDDSATVKRIFHEKDGRIRLQPANDSMEPIYLTEQDISYGAIIGIVIGLFRQF